MARPALLEAHAVLRFAPAGFAEHPPEDAFGSELSRSLKHCGTQRLMKDHEGFCITRS